MTYTHLTPAIGMSRLPDLRKVHKLTLDELAAKLDISKHTVAAIEKGRYDPPLSLAMKIANTLDVSVEKLYDK
jgi:putative transcriptional regulator